MYSSRHVFTAASVMLVASLTLSAATLADEGALQLSGTAPASVAAGTTYSFTPALTNTTGQPAAFSVVNKPEWMSFNTATGTLSGTPDASQAGVYRDIAISASNGKTQTWLTAYWLTVEANASRSQDSASGTANLSWLPPTATVGGDSLQDLAGYKLYYGNDAADLSQSVAVTNPGLTTHALSGLPAGEWFFAVTAYTYAGLESDKSAIASKWVN